MFQKFTQALFEVFGGGCLTLLLGGLVAAFTQYDLLARVLILLGASTIGLVFATSVGLRLARRVYS